MKEINLKILNKEQWKYTKISNFNKFKFNSTPNNLYKKKTKNNSCNILIKNSKLNFSNINESNIIITNLESALKNKLFNLNKLFNQIIPKNENPFIELNNYNYKNGIFVHIKNNTNQKDPIIIKYDVNENSNDTFANERFFISIGKNVNVKIFLEEKISKKCNLNTVTELFIDKNSKLDLIYFSQKPKVTQIHNFSSVINNNSCLNISPIDISGKLIKKNFYINLNQENSACNFNSLNMLNNNNHIDNFIKINHSKKHTFSTLNHRNILSGKSTSIFYAKAIIENNSINSEANQSNKNIMLSDRATIHSNPQFEIYNNDVKCAHGSTTGEIDKDVLFYMQSRGINPIDGKKLILKGFSNEIIDKINTNVIKNKIAVDINNWFLNVT